MDELQPKRVDRIFSIRKDVPDTIFLTCGSFEERCLGVPQRCETNFSERIVLFRFTEPNEKRENLIEEMQSLFKIETFEEKYYTIAVEHGKSTESILKFHNYCKHNSLLGHKNLVITMDITTFTKSLLLDTLFYIRKFLNVEKLRLLYTIPKNYASPEEGELSYGIKGIHILPFYWNEWFSTRDDLLIIILGYEEMRAWSLINKFDANVNLLFVTKPGSIPTWDTYCEKYNELLLKEIPSKDSISALNPVETSNVLKKYITDAITKKYNIFISPLGTKPQIIGIFFYLLSNPKIPLNIITTTPVEHNIPYYSWGIGNTFQFFLPLPKVNTL
ncbi:MAG: hypothetical protein A3G93_10745 [Nitrospinae bacterium RIFCSPLOWO2_12_FULL_45_22]|nr:MAG: hypothetical protein A3G93_10745 [Nitrospinae bacterium RIFCSPLOWO2_12_FULL_45_22]